ncbi:c-di-GMP-binding flagellar brake protein YcgR, contains PilZNR and PilZ domains [Paenibacillus catalpae]|uniref:C-di-GMP-binding flagellar brake protein YcgR, contains PilZNR and PilZ domains n=1 Tax=Paenibacillus catalpae TaxID=1045775 RepID=A0A1I2FHT1_9BACL|nr:flagellar brake domain-containing protein [Paenibacillus catalpae]SFF04318.1 c-di-GMP-binding flagellar brake protein YcgR, contains PilZNR and PilZ domains [Paenibacillus catalpae]
MLPRVNQMLFFEIASADEEEAAVEYKARIADELEDGLLIENPLNTTTGRMKRLFLGDELSVYYVSEDGIKHYFDSHVIGFRDDVVKLIKIRKPDPARITKVQRRHFLRVAADLEIAVNLSGNIRFVTLTDDVGGGGISFICDGKWPIQPGMEMDCWLLIPYKNGTLEHSSFKAEVVRVVDIVTGRKQIMSKYITIGDSERQKIIRYCFEKQLEFRGR